MSMEPGARLQLDCGHTRDTVLRDVGVGILFPCFVPEDARGGRRRGVHRLPAWRDEFVAGGIEGLKAKPLQPEDRRLRDAERKIGELTMDNEILRAAARKRGALDSAAEAAEIVVELEVARSECAMS
jgi:hypothetical protein